MTARCPECGAALGDGETCTDLFNRMLATEWSAIGEAGSGIPEADFLKTPQGEEGLRVHFFAVGTYQLQHPDRLTSKALHGLYDDVARILGGTARIGDVRAGARRAFDGPARVRRREGGRDPGLGPWPSVWPKTVADVCDVAPSAYFAAVRQWAEATVSAIRSAQREG